MVGVAPFSATERSQGHILRLYGNGEVFVEDVYEYLNALEYAYNCAYVLESITQQAEEIARQYGEPPIPLRNLLWVSWWPPNPEKVAGLVPREDRIKLIGVELHSPGFWDFMGKLNPLEVIRQYLNDRHERRKDRDYRETAEARKLELENRRSEIQILRETIQLLRDMGATPQDIALLKDGLIYNSLQGLNSTQDRGLIVDAEIVNPDLEKKKERRTPF